MRKLFAAPVLAVACLVMSAAPALAQVAPDGNASPDAPVSAVFTVNNLLVVFLTGTLVPILNGFLLRPENPTWVKVLVANALGTIVHAFSQVIQEDGTAVLTQEWFVGLGMTLVTMAAMYGNFWKPLTNPNSTLPTVLPAGDVIDLRRAA
jgi:hypothetical protein